MSGSGGTSLSWGPSATLPRLRQPLSWHREYRSRFTNTETLLFCMRVMVGVIILYDHVHPVGAFAKTSKIDVSQRGVTPVGSQAMPLIPGAMIPEVPLSGLSSEDEDGEEGGQPPQGAHSLSLCPHQMKGCIKVLKDQPSTSTEGLLNALR